MAVHVYSAVVGISGSDTLTKGQTLYAPTELTAESGNVRLHVQGDGNLVIVQNESLILWASNTSHCQPDGKCHLILRDDGDVAFYGCPDCGKVLWETHTAGSLFFLPPQHTLSAPTLLACNCRLYP